MTRALVVVDVQNDFCEGGSLPINGGARVAAGISAILSDTDTPWDHVVATKDYHIDPGTHFSHHPNFVDTWPVHCAVGSAGADFHPELDTERIEAVFTKGEHTAAYSGFEARTHVDGQPVRLGDWLRAHHVTVVDLVGLATDHCVLATALDARREGFATTVLLGLTAGVSRDTTAAALARLSAARVSLLGTPTTTP
jgi:nicotinamidase/pyrazinamidase